MKYLILTISFIFGEKLFAQHNYSFMPNTINVNVIKPLSPVKPVDYGQQVSNLSNSLNDVAASRAAKRQELENITNEALQEIQSYLAIGYSTSVNKMLSITQSSASTNVKSFYGKLTSANIDPDDYPSIISKEVNNYKFFAFAINSFNELLKNKLDDLKNNNQFDRITSISNAIDNYVGSAFVLGQFNTISKNKRYSLIIDQRIEIERYTILNTQEFLNSLISILNSYGSQSESNLFNLEILTDLELSKSILYEQAPSNNSLNKRLSIAIPISYKVKMNNEWERKYLDGTLLNVKVDYKLFKNDVGTNISPVEYLDSINKNENYIMRFNIKLGLDGGVLFLEKEEKDDYGDIKKFLNVTCINAIDDKMIKITYKIQISNSLAQKDYKEVFEELKPLIKGINDSVKIID